MQNSLHHQFNGFLMDTLFFFADEAFWHGDRKAVGYLKSLITDEKQMGEKKYIDPFEMRNRVTLILASNERIVVPAELDDRRWAVFRFNEEKKCDKKFFSQLQQDIEREKQAFLHYLLHLDITDYDPIQRPKQLMINLWEQKVQHMNSEQLWWFNVLQEGFIFYETDGWPEKITLEHLFTKYNNNVKKEYDKIKNSKILWGYLKRSMLPTSFDYTPTQKRRRIYIK